MSIKIKSTEFQAEVSKLLDQYQTNLYTQLEPTLKMTANEARKELRHRSPSDNGYYKGGWQYKVEMSSRMGGGTMIIYNQRPGLTHLLEKGHLVSNGTGRVVGKAEAKEHIAFVNDWAQKRAIENIRKVIGETEINFV